MMGDVDIDILNRRSSINFGSIFENVAAQEFKACGRELRYYNSSKIGEVDFVLQGQQGGIDLCEIKSGKNYRRHSALDNLLTTKTTASNMSTYFMTAMWILQELSKVLRISLFI